MTIILGFVRIIFSCPLVKVSRGLLNGPNLQLYDQFRRQEWHHCAASHIGLCSAAVLADLVDG